MLRNGIARLQIFSDDPDMRLQAAVNLLKSAEDLDQATLDEALDNEEKTDVRDVLLLVKGIRLLEAETEKERIAGVKLLSGSLYPDVRGALANYRRAAEADSRTEEIQAADEALKKIESLLSLNSVAENLYFGKPPISKCCSIICQCGIIIEDNICKEYLQTKLNPWK